MVNIICGKKLAKYIANSFLSDLKSKIALTCNSPNRKPHLVIYHLNNLKSSEIFIKQKIKFAAKWEIDVSVRKLDEFLHENDILENIRLSNMNPAVTSIVVQLPLAPNLHFSQNVLDSVDPIKDVDALGHYNKQQILDSHLDSIFIPPTVYGVLALICVHHSLTGNKIGVVGQGPTLGEPCSTLLERMNNNVIRMDSLTPNIHQLCSDCEIIISASGQPNHINSHCMKENCGVIDGGAFDEMVNEAQSSVYVDESAKLKLAWLSPSTGGLGPLTVTWLFYNVYLSFLRQQGVPTPSFESTIENLVSMIRNDRNSFISN